MGGRLAEPIAEHPARSGVRQSSLARGAWEGSSPALRQPGARQPAELNHKGCCFHKICWREVGDRRGSGKEKKKKKEG